jgi:hypothetical protein
VVYNQGVESGFTIFGMRCVIGPQGAHWPDDMVALAIDGKVAAVIKNIAARGLDASGEPPKTMERAAVPLDWVELSD